MESTTTANAAASATAAGQKAQEEGTRIFTQTVDRLKDGIATTTRNIEQAQASMRQSTENAMAYGQGAMQGLLRAGQAYGHGAQDLMRQAVTSLQARFDEGCAAARALQTAKSARETIEICSGFGQSCLEHAFADFNRQVNGWMKLNEQNMSMLSQAALRPAERGMRQG